MGRDCCSANHDKPSVVVVTGNNLTASQWTGSFQPPCTTSYHCLGKAVRRCGACLCPQGSFLLWPIEYKTHSFLTRRFSLGLTSMAEILGLASSIIAVVGVAGKLSTSTIQLKRLWDEVQDVPASVRRCIEHLEFLAPAIEEMDDEFQRTGTMVQNDSAAKRSLEYSRKAVATLECLVRDMETQLTTAKKGRRLVAQLKVRMKKEMIEEHQQQLQSVLQLVLLSQQTYLMLVNLLEIGRASK